MSNLSEHASESRPAKRRWKSSWNSRQRWRPWASSVFRHIGTNPSRRADAFPRTGLDGAGAAPAETAFSLIPGLVNEPATISCPAVRFYFKHVSRKWT
jgi:hypothetical protein